MVNIPPALAQRKGLIGVVVVGAGAGFYIIKKRSSAAASTATTTDDTTDGSATDTGAYGDYSAASGTAVGVTPGLADSTVTPTNASWATTAEGTLTNFGYDPATVALALGKYLLGNDLTTTQMEIVQAAIGQEGYPPVGVPAPHVTPPTGQTTKTKTTPTQAQARAASPQLASMYHAYQVLENQLAGEKKAHNAARTAQVQKQADAAQHTYQAAYNIYVQTYMKS